MTRLPHRCVPEAARADWAAWRAETRTNPYDRSPALDLALRLYAPALHAAHADRLRALGADVAGSVETDAFAAEEHPPVLERYDGLGHRTEGIDFHPAYFRMGAVAWAARCMADYAEPGLEMVQLAAFFLLAHQGEAPHLCPMSCTAGLIKAIQAKGSPFLRDTYLPGLLDPDYSKTLIGAQFVTEAQGGSDVGAGAVRAVPIEGAPVESYAITGEKWFCSVANADLYLLTARVDDQGEGTAGLGCFVVPRRLPGGETNHFCLRRLKKKLGTRAMASAEIDWDGAVAYPIGPVTQGFKTVVELVLQTSRVYNAMGTTGAMARATLDATAYARHRRAFGHAIHDFPEVRRTLARMTANTWGCLFSTAHVIQLSETLATDSSGDPKADRAALRMLTNVNKYWTSLANTRTIRDGMEVLGGNGTIEDFSVLPRLYRDSMVLESWEGAHNVLCAQLLRDTLRGHLDTPMLEALAALAASAAEGPRRNRLEVRLAGVRQGYDALRELTPEGAQAAIRVLVDRTAVAYQLAALLPAADLDAPGAATAGACFDQLEALYPVNSFRAAPMNLVDACLGADA